MSISTINNESFSELLQDVSDIDGMDDEKMRLYKLKFIELKKYKENLLDLDLNLKEYMYATKNSNDVIADTEICEMIEEIRDDSLIIFVKKAQLYKIYNPEGLDDFEQDVGTHYRKSECGPAYEVVRDSHPQKLMIVVQDDIKDDSLNSIKQHILEFIKKKPTYSSMSTSDLTIYNCDNNTEIVVGSLKFKNIHEKEQFIESFIVFMQDRGESELANKIQLRHPPSNIPGTRYYQLPCSKTLIAGNSLNLTDQLITTNRSSPVIINNTFIIQNNVGNINTVNNINTIVTNSDATGGKTIKSFCKHIYTNKPTWYIENTYVSFDVIEIAYRAYFDDQNTSKSVISRQLKSKIFDVSTRVGRVVKKKLFTYNILKNSN
jgi:hypothetical protein